MSPSFKEGAEGTNAEAEADELRVSSSTRSVPSLLREEDFIMATACLTSVLGGQWAKVIVHLLVHQVGSSRMNESELAILLDIDFIKGPLDSSCCTSRCESVLAQGFSLMGSQRKSRIDDWDEEVEWFFDRCFMLPNSGSKPSCL